MLLLTSITLNCLLLTLGTQAYPMAMSYHQRHALHKRHHNNNNAQQLDNINTANSVRLQMSASSPTTIATEEASTSDTNDNGSQIVVGKFKAPSPDKIQKSRVKSTQGAQIMSASMRVSDGSDDRSLLREKTVHGKVSGPPPNQRYVSAKIQVSDEGLNYPPSKLSADIYGNVAEIITAPPEAIDGDFLLNQSSYFNADENDQQHALREARRQRT